MVLHQLETGQERFDHQVIDVHKLDPTANGTHVSSRCWQLRDPAQPCAQFPIWIEDLRAVKLHLTKDKVRIGRSAGSAVNPNDVCWEISPTERESYLTTLPLVMKDGKNDDSHASQRAKARFDQTTSEGSEIESE